MLKKLSSSLVAKSIPEQVERTKKNLEDTVTEFYMPKQSKARYSTGKINAKKRLSMLHGG